MILTWMRVFSKGLIILRRISASKRRWLLIGKRPSKRIVIWMMFQLHKKLITIIPSRKAQKRYLRRESAKDVKVMLLIAVQLVLVCLQQAEVESVDFQ